MVPEMVLSRWFSCWFSIAVAATAPPERSGFSPAAGAIWAPASANASYVFLRTASPIALPAQLVSARIVVSSLPDCGTGDGNQRLLAAYRLFANGVEVGIGPGRGRKPTHPSYWMDVVSDSIVLDASLLAGGTLSLALQCFAERILVAVGTPSDNAADAAAYCRISLATTVLMLLANHLRTVFVNLGFMKLTAFGALLSGVGVDVGLTFLLVLRLDMGVRGAALVQLSVQATQVALWVAAALCMGLGKRLFVPPRGSGASDPLFTWREAREFMGQALPEWGGALSDWGIFELQFVLLTNIRAIPSGALTAGAIWITAEGAFASIQSGWVAVAKMRTLKLLGQRDAGAPKAFALFLALSFGLVSLCCVPLYVPYTATAISHGLSNDVHVAWWFARLLWVLAIKSQTRILQVTLNSVFVPMVSARARMRGSNASALARCETLTNGPSRGVRAGPRQDTRHSFRRQLRPTRRAVCIGRRAE